MNIFRDALLAAAFVASPSYAIDPQRAMSQYIRDHWGPEQGFPRGSVYAITQTADGYLWIGTETGLLRFDGWNFSLMRDQSGSVPLTSVIGLAPDRDGSLWVRFRNMTLVRYRNGEFESPFSHPDSVSNITAMSRTKARELLVAKMQLGAFTYRDGALQLVAAATDVPRSPVIAVAQTGNGEVWLGTRGAGLFRLEGGRTFPIAKGLPDPKINCLLPGTDNDLWIGTDNGIVRWNGTELTSAGTPASLNHVQILTMTRDRDANMWVGTDSRGLLRVNAQGVSPLDKGESAKGEGTAVTALFEDREGNVWAGSTNGIERLRDSAFITYSGPEGLPSDGSNPVFVDSENRLWFPPVDGGLWWVKDGQHGRVNQAGLDQDVVYSIAGRKGEVWLGRQRGGLTRLRSEQGSYTTKTFTEADGLAQNSVYSVYPARDGAIWAGTLSGGVSKLSGGKFTNYTIANGLSSNTVASILESSDGIMWFATPTGLSALSKGSWRVYTAKDGLPSENINCFLEDSAGVLWIGTTAGLAFRGPGGFQVPVGMPGSLHEQILGIAEDRYGSLWISTSNHVLRVKRDHLLQGTLAEEDVRGYGIADGLRGLEGVKRHQSAITDPFGRIWLSLNRGISVVDPARLTGNSVPAMVHIQTISADGNAIEVRDPVRLPAHSRRMVFGYSGLSLSVPERVRFRYMLEGFDHSWSEPVAEREAVYTNLGPGPYRFRVIASNPDGVWSSQEAAVAFDVAPLFWQTSWFRVGVVLACAMAAFGLYRLRWRQMTRRLNLRFEERLAERTRIAQDLHDTLLQGFLSASMQLHVTVDGLSSDSPAKPSLTRILNLMGQVIDEGRNAVRDLRSTHSGFLDLGQAFSRIQQEFPTREEVDFRVIVNGQPRPIHPVLRDEIYRIGREALVNAFRHSRAGNIEIEVEHTAKHLRILVRDNGIGIDPQVLQSGREGHWGLPGMRERAERIGARLHVWSSTTGGTEVELSVPSKIAFQSEPSKGGHL